MIFEFAGHWQEIGRPARWGSLPRRQAVSDHGTEEHQTRGRVHRLGGDGQRQSCPDFALTLRVRWTSARSPARPPMAAKSRLTRNPRSATSGADRGRPARTRATPESRLAARPFTSSPRRRCTSNVTNRWIQFGGEAGPARRRTSSGMRLSLQSTDSSFGAAACRTFYRFDCLHILPNSTNLALFRRYSILLATAFCFHNRTWQDRSAVRD